MIHNLTYELSLLARSVQHRNLSAAAAHVGLSQPQLSRIIHKIEKELNLVLLDRSARRKSAWLPMAHELSAIFLRSMGRLEAEVISLAEDATINELHVGSLEGLAEIASDFVNTAFEKIGFRKIYLDVLDFRDLDSHFLNGNLDLVFTVRPPSKQEFSHLVEVGFQQTERVSTEKSTLVVSQYELAGHDKKEVEAYPHILVSNSLSVRKQYLDHFGGVGNVPTDAKTGKGKGQYTIFLIGSELLPPKLWEQIITLF